MTTVASAGGCADGPSPADDRSTAGPRPCRSRCTDQLRGEHGLVQRRSGPCPPARPPTVTRQRARSYGGWSPRRGSIAGSGAARSITSGSTGSACGRLDRGHPGGPSGCGSPAGRQEAGGGQAQPGHDGARSGDTGQVSVQGPAQVGQHTGRQHPPDVAGLTGQRGRATHPAGHPRLGDALRPAAVRGSSARTPAGPVRGGARRPPAHAGRRRRETAGPPGCRARSPRSRAGCRRGDPDRCRSHRPPSRTVRRSDMLQPIRFRTGDVDGRLPAIAAAHDPAELVRPPGRCRGLPGGDGRATDTEDVRVRVRSEQVRAPVLLGGRVVVQEADDVAGGGVDAGVAGAGEALGGRVRQHRGRREGDPRHGRAGRRCGRSRRRSRRPVDAAPAPSSPPGRAAPSEPRCRRR